MYLLLNPILFMIVLTLIWWWKANNSASLRLSLLIVPLRYLLYDCLILWRCSCLSPYDRALSSLYCDGVLPFLCSIHYLLTQLLYYRFIFSAFNLLSVKRLLMMLKSLPPCLIVLLEFRFKFRFKTLQSRLILSLVGLLGLAQLSFASAFLRSIFA